VSIYIYIGGTIREIVPYTLSLNATLNNRATVGCRVVSTSGSYRPQQGEVIEIHSGATKLWAGSIDEVSEVSITEAGAAAGAFYDVSGITWEQRLDRRRCFNATTQLPAHYDGSILYTANASTNTLTTAAAHGLTNGKKVRVKAHAQGAICGGLSGTIEYFVITAASTTLQLSLTLAGSAVDITDTGTLEQALVTNRAGTIVKDLVSTFASFEGIGTTNVSDGPVVDVITFEPSTNVSSAIGQLAVLSEYIWWIDEEKELYFKPRTFLAAPFSISTASGNYRSIQARRTREDKTNATVTRVPAEEVAPLDESFAGDGTTQTFTLSDELGQIVSIKVNDQDVDFGQWFFDTGKAFYWEFGSTKIRQDATADVLTSADTLAVSYRSLGSDTITAEDASDITSTIALEGSGSGRYESYFERPVGQLQALLEAQQLIALKKDAITEISYETDEQVEPLCVTLRPGQIQTIANTPRGVSSSSYLIHDVQISDVAGLYLRCRVKAISGTSIVGVQEYWRALAGMGGSTSTVAPAGGGSSSTNTPTAPGDVTSVSATSEFADDTTLRIKIAFTAPSPLGDFVGVHVWEEPVDQSTGGAVPLNSTATLAGTLNLGGTFAPVDRGYHLTTPATIYIPRPTQTETKRFYVASYSETAEAELVRAGSANATPNVTISVGDTVYQSGEEYARLVTGVSVTVQYDDTQVASPKYRLVFGWTAPADPPAAWQRPFGGVQIVYEFADGNRAQGPALAVNETSARGPWEELFVGSAIIKCWFVSMDASDEPRLNTIVSDLTPTASSTVTWPLASRPVISPYADNVTGFTATNSRYATNSQGQKALFIDLAWTRPSGDAALARWGGAVVWLHFPNGDKVQMSGPETGSALTIETGAFPQTTETWTFYAVSLDNNANPNTDGRAPAVGTPVATISVSPPASGAAGTEYTSHVTGASFAAASVSASDGTTQQRITATFTAPSDVTWGGVELRVYSGSTLLSSVAATPSPIAVNIPNPSAVTTVTAKLVSFDVNNRTNTEVGATPQNTLSIGSAAGTLDLTRYLPASTNLFTISGGQIIVAANQITETAIASDSISTVKIKANAITANEIAAGAVIAGKIFANAVTATTILAGAVTTAKLDTTEISVGGGGSKPGKFGVYDAGASQIGFIGKEGSDYGGWFKTLSVGGTSFGTGKLKADSSGNVTIADATLTLNLNGITTVISNVNDGIGSVIAGMRITDNSTSYYTSYRADSVSLTDGSVSRVLISAGGGSPDPGGRVSVNNTSGSTTITLTGGSGIVSASSFSIGATPGVTGTVSPITSTSTGSTSFVTGINTTLVTINYKDHSSTNQTASFLAFASTTNANAISSISTFTTTLTFTGGIRT
jgi:hypothetical protein